MPHFLMTREARFTHRQTFVVKARNAEYAGYVESIDVDRYRLLKGESENRSGWNTQDDETKEISAEEAEKLFETKDRAGVQGEDADMAREECAKLVEEFAKCGPVDPVTLHLLEEPPAVWEVLRTDDPRRRQEVALLTDRQASSAMPLLAVAYEVGASRLALHERGHAASARPPDRVGDLVTTLSLGEHDRTPPRATEPADGEFDQLAVGHD